MQECAHHQKINESVMQFLILYIKSVQVLFDSFDSLIF